MTFVFIGDRRLRMRRAMLHATGIRKSRRSITGHRTKYCYTVTFERGPAVGIGMSRSFLVAAAKAIWATYANMLYQRQLRQTDA